MFIENPILVRGPSSVLSVTLRGTSNVVEVYARRRAALERTSHSPYISDVYRSMCARQSELVPAAEYFSALLSGIDWNGLRCQRASPPYTKNRRS